MSKESARETRPAQRVDTLRIVTSLGLVSRKGEALTPQTFGALLRNPIYSGIFNAKAFGLRGIRGDFEPLISEGLFQRARVALSGPVATAHDLNNPQFPLRRFVLCDACGTPLTGSAPRGRSKRYAYYHCRECRGVSVRKEQLEARFVELLRSLQPRPEFARLFREIVLDVWNARRRNAVAVEDALRSRLGELQRRETLLERAFLYDGKIDEQTY